MEECGMNKNDKMKKLDCHEQAQGQTEGQGQAEGQPQTQSKCQGQGQESKPTSGLSALLFRFKYFLLWFLGFFGFFAMNTHCPCCGQNVCPAGAGLLAAVSGIFALLMQFGRGILAYIKKIFLQMCKIFKS